MDGSFGLAVLLRVRGAAFLMRLGLAEISPDQPVCGRTWGWQTLRVH